MFSAIRVLRNYNPTARAISLSSATCRCITTTSPPSSVAANDTELIEGSYTAALKGSTSAVSDTAAVTPEFDARGVVGSGACYKCGLEGHWAKDCSVSSSVSGNEVAKKCACGAGSCVVRIANTERNRGRKFYRCPVRQENGGCGFFEWCDGSAGDNASGQERARKSGRQQDVYQTPSIRPDNKNYGVKTGSPCFKCGGEGHWARDCPTTISSGTATGVRDKPSSNVCYKCGQPGHWAKDCSQSQTTTGVPYH